MTYHRFLCWVLVLAALLAAISCGCEYEKRPNPSEVKQLLNKKLPVRVENRARISVSHGMEVYIDASESLAGFTKGSNSSPAETKYRNFLQILRLWLIQKPGARLFRFGDAVHSISACDEAAVPGFYSDMHTNLVDLVRSIAARDSSISETYLIVTDGIPSVAKKSDLIDLTAPIIEMINKGYHFAVLGMRSEFDGPVFSETLGGQRLRDRYSSGVFGERPFYVLVLSINKDVVRQLTDKMLGKNLSWRSITVSSRNYGIATPTYDVSSLEAPSEKNPLRIYAEEESVLYLWWRNNLSPPGRLQVTIEVKPAASGSAFGIDPRYLSDSVACTHVKSGELLPPGIVLMNAERDRFNEARINCSFSLDKMQRPGWSAIKIVLYGREGLFEPPQWVGEWSSDRDVAVKDFQNTLFLKEFLASVLAGVDKGPLAVCYMAIKGG